MKFFFTKVGGEKITNDMKRKMQNVNCCIMYSDYLGIFSIINVCFSIKIHLYIEYVFN